MPSRMEHEMDPTRRAALDAALVDLTRLFTETPRRCPTVRPVAACGCGRYTYAPHVTRCCGCGGDMVRL